ncbi:hypothetical protein GpartN1_g4627.t1 [Galdieria partita]|uniref:Nucleotide exchange factor SIL1 n=1 Tax=Galdieria partita TaxID=83374 RepID=A0A9C7URI3_9RHOD|nr:hypothetical protein GpartN1_g4627.t1 [Galdieria partita]
MVWKKPTLLFLLWLSLLQITTTESSQVVSLAVQTNVEEVKAGKIHNVSPVAPETQWRVAKVLQQAQDRENRAVQEVLKEQKQEKEVVQTVDVNEDKVLPDTRKEENCVGSSESIDTVAKLFQWSILASTNRNTEKLMKSESENEMDVQEREENVSFIQHVAQFFRKARSHLKDVRKTRALRNKYESELEQDFLYSVVMELFEARNEAEKTKALEILAELAHKMENAKDILALGGLETILELLNSHSARVRSLALYTLAVCAQNNEWVQTYLMQIKRLERLVHIAERDKESNVRTTALLALSSIVDNRKGMDMLQVIDGVENVLLDAVQNEDDLRAIRRALNLASELIVLDASQWLEKLKRVRFFEFAEYYLEHHENRDIRESAAQLLSLLQ